MAISPISSVSFNNYNNVTFEGRRNKKHRNYDSLNTTNTISHKLSVPTFALLLSMMPMSSSAEFKIEPNDKPEIENVEQSQKDKVLARAEFKNGMSNGATVNIEYVSTDGNDDDIELITVTYNDIQKVKVNGKYGRRNISSTVNVDTLKVENVTERFDDGSINKYKRYYIKGEGSFYKSRVLSDDGEILEKSSNLQRFSNQSLAISKDLYEYLKNLMGSDVQYKSVNVQEKGYERSDDEDYS